MSFTPEVSDFMQSLGPFYESIEEEEEAHFTDSGVELEPGNVNALLGNFDDAFTDQMDHDSHSKAFQ